MTGLQKTIKYLALAFAIFLIVSIVSGAVFGTELVLKIGEYFGGEDETAAGEVIQNDSTDDLAGEKLDVKDDFKKLKIDLKAVALKLSTGDKFSVVSNSKYIKAQTDGALLTVSDTRTGTKAKVGFVRITLPKNKKLDMLEIDSGAGEVTVGNISANEMNIDLGAGAAFFSKLTAKERLSISVGAGKATFDSIVSKASTKIDVGAGQFTVKSGELKNADINIGMGEMYITSSFSGESKFNVGIGSAKVCISGKPENYSFDISKGIGRVAIDGTSMTDGSRYGSGKNMVYVDCGIGEMRVEFKGSSD